MIRRANDNDTHHPLSEPLLNHFLGLMESEPFEPLPRICVPSTYEWLRQELNVKRDGDPVQCCIATPPIFRPEDLNAYQTVIAGLLREVLALRRRVEHQEIEAAGSTADRDTPNCSCTNKKPAQRFMSHEVARMERELINNYLRSMGADLATDGH